MTRKEILKILETAKDKNGDIPMRLVRQAFEKLPEPCDDTISRQAAIDAVERNSCNTQRAIDAVNALPSAQPERKKGKWIRESAGAWMWTCSYCGKDDAYAYSADDAYEPTVLQDFYCPNCGAKMEE